MQDRSPHKARIDDKVQPPVLVKSIEELDKKIKDHSVLTIDVDLSSVNELKAKAKVFDYNKLFELLNNKKVKCIKLRSYYTVALAEQTLPAEKLKELLTGNDHLLELTINSNEIKKRAQFGLDTSAAQNIAQALAKNRTLQILNLEVNKIGNKGAVLLLNAFSASSSLLALNISMNLINMNNGEKRTPDEDVFACIEGIVIKTNFQQNESNQKPALTRRITLRYCAANGAISSRKCDELGTILKNKKDENKQSNLPQQPIEIIVNKNDLPRTKFEYQDDKSEVDLVQLCSSINEPVVSNQVKSKLTATKNKNLKPSQAAKTPLAEAREVNEEERAKLNRLYRKLDESHFEWWFYSNKNLDKFNRAVNEIVELLLEKDKLQNESDLEESQRQALDKLREKQSVLKRNIEDFPALSEIVNELIRLKYDVKSLLEPERKEKDFNTQIDQLEKEVQSFEEKVKTVCDPRLPRIKKEKKKAEKEKKLDHMEEVNQVIIDVFPIYQKQINTLQVIVENFNDTALEEIKTKLVKLLSALKELSENKCDPDFDKKFQCMKDELDSIEGKLQPLKEGIEDLETKVADKMCSDRNHELLQRKKQELTPIHQRINRLQEIIQQLEKQNVIVQMTHKKRLGSIRDRLLTLEKIDSLDQFNERFAAIMDHLKSDLRLLENALRPINIPSLSTQSVIVHDEDFHPEDFHPEDFHPEEKTKENEQGSKPVDQQQIPQDVLLDDFMAKFKKEHGLKSSQSNMTLPKDELRKRNPPVNSSHIEEPTQKRKTKNKKHNRSNITRWLLYAFLGALVIGGLALAATGIGELMLGAAAIGGILIASGSGAAATGSGGLIYSACHFNSSHKKMSKKFNKNKKKIMNQALSITPSMPASEDVPNLVIPESGFSGLITLDQDFSLKNARNP